MPLYNLVVSVSIEDRSVNNVRANSLTDAKEKVFNQLEQDLSLQNDTYSLELIDYQEVLDSRSYISMASVLNQTSPEVNDSYTPLNDIQDNANVATSGYTRFS